MSAVIPPIRDDLSVYVFLAISVVGTLAVVAVAVWRIVKGGGR
jgi:hypothetical protein